MANRKKRSLTPKRLFIIKVTPEGYTYQAGVIRRGYYAPYIYLSSDTAQAAIDRMGPTRIARLNDFFKEDFTLEVKEVKLVEIDDETKKSEVQ